MSSRDRDPVTRDEVTVSLCVHLASAPLFFGAAPLTHRGLMSAFRIDAHGPVSTCANVPISREARPGWRPERAQVCGKRCRALLKFSPGHRFPGLGFVQADDGLTVGFRCGEA